MLIIFEILNFYKHNLMCLFPVDIIQIFLLILIVCINFFNENTWFNVWSYVKCFFVNYYTIYNFNLMVWELSFNLYWTQNKGALHYNFQTLLHKYVFFKMLLLYITMHKMLWNKLFDNYTPFFNLSIIDEYREETLS